MAVFIKQFDIKEVLPDTWFSSKEIMDTVKNTTAPDGNGFYAVFAQFLKPLKIPEYYGNTTVVLGRCGVRDITSVWAKENYPTAQYEVVITIVNSDTGEVDFFISYF